MVFIEIMSRHTPADGKVYVSRLRFWDSEQELRVYNPPIISTISLLEMSKVPFKELTYSYIPWEKENMDSKVPFFNPCNMSVPRSVVNFSFFWYTCVCEWP